MNTSPHDHADPVGFSFRRAVPDDAPDIVAVHRAAVHGRAAGSYPPETLEAWSPSVVVEARLTSLRRRLAGGRELSLVARGPGGDAVGFGTVIPTEGLLGAVYVRPEGARRGVGAAILRRLERLAVEHGVRELSMDASVNAEVFYRAHGYLVMARGEHALSAGGTMACVHMRKSLASARPPATFR